MRLMKNVLIEVSIQSYLHKYFLYLFINNNGRKFIIHRHNIVFINNNWLKVGE